MLNVDTLEAELDKATGRAWIRMGSDALITPMHFESDVDDFKSLKLSSKITVTRISTRANKSLILVRPIRNREA